MNGPMLNAYPDSLGGTLADAVRLLQRPELEGVFDAFYILPSLFNTDLDRGFSVIDYSLNECLATPADLAVLAEMGISLKLDFILNHASVLSPQFQDILKKGQASEYRDFFIDWNAFWQGHGEMTEEGYIQPDPALIKDMFFRKPGLPILMVRLPDGSSVPYWNTFYQEIRYPHPDAQDIMQCTGLQYCAAEQLAAVVRAALENGAEPARMDLGRWEAHRPAVVDWLEGRRKYLGQMDLNISSPLVWQFYAQTLQALAGYGASVVRLDAFAYAPKQPGARNFLNDPGTWELLDGVRQLADKHSLALLPEIHASYAEGTYEAIARKGYITYDFFLPGLILDALERKSGEALRRWAIELVEKKIQTVNMLGCHDGIPLLDLQGLIAEEQIQSLIDTVVSRGGYVKNLHGQKNVYYQVNATYYSALGGDDARLLLARALQIFMPGQPQVWYLDLFAGENDREAVARAGAGGHKEINRTNLTTAQIEAGLEKPVVKGQLDLLRFRKSFAAFGPEAELVFTLEQPHLLQIEWRAAGCTAVLTADLARAEFTVMGLTPDGEVYRFTGGEAQQ